MLLLLLQDSRVELVVSVVSNWTVQFAALVLDLWPRNQVITALWLVGVAKFYFVDLEELAWLYELWGLQL